MEEMITMQHDTRLADAASAEVRAEMARHNPPVTGLALAREIGTSQNYLAKRLRNEAPLNLEDLASICDALGVPFSELMHRALGGMEEDS